jgi:hypothetical protein
MYIFHTPTGRDEHARFQGLSDGSEDELLQKSLAAIRAVLELNPRTGYVKGSPARKQLEEAFELVPQSSALELTDQLLKREGPLERLFRYRLHAATQQAMLSILLKKAKEFQQQKRDELRRMEEEQRRRNLEISRKLEENRQKMCANLKMKDSLIDEVCRRTGEGSDQCRKLRSEALKAREQFRMEGGRCP